MALAKTQKRAFLFEGAVLDGLPVFSLVRNTLPGVEVSGFRGIVNSTTNFILTAMEEGVPLEDALRQAQALGICEKNPDYDLDGWDAAAKTAILVNALLGQKITPPEVTRTGIRSLTTRMVIEALRQGRRFKLLAEGQWREGQLVARVAPRMLALNDPLAHVSGSSAALTLMTDTLGEITIHLKEGEVPQTAYALFSDLVTVLQDYYAE
jgi:homoserine dehydrogenase